MMELDDKTADDVLARVNSKCMPYVCPMCKQKTNFIFAKGESQLLSLKREGLQLIINNEVDFIPALTGFCQNCGYIVQFNLRSYLQE